VQVKFKGLPHVIWRHHDELDDDQQQRLKNVLKEYPCLTIAYELKEELYTIYKTARSFRSGQRQLRRWLRVARLLFHDVAAMIERHFEGSRQHFEIALRAV